jgi:uncharacterized membrane protein
VIAKTPLPDGDIASELIPNAINFILALLAIGITAMITYSGVLYVTNMGEEETLTQARKYIVNGILGLALIGLAYAFIFAVTQLDFSVG